MIPNIRSLIFLLVASCVLIGAPASIWAQSQSGPKTPPSPQPAPDEKLSLAFKDVDIRVFIQFIAKLSGKTYVVSDKVTGRVTVISPGPVSIEEALRIFESVLEVKGFTTVQTGDVVKVVPGREGRWQGGPLVQPGDRVPPDTDQIVTQVIHLKHASADEVKRGIRPLAGLHANVASYPESNTLVITDVASNVRRLVKILETLDRPGAQSQVRVVPLQYASAKDMAQALSQLFARPSTPKRKLPVQLQGRPQLKVLADERTNSLILLGASFDIERAVETIKDLDLPESEARFNIHVIRLKYAVAEDMAKVFTQLAGGGEIKPQTAQDKKKGQTPLAERVQLLSGTIRIVADPATNSLIVSASPKEFKVIEAIVAKLDVPRTMVYVEAVILEMSATKSLEFGVNWNVASDNEQGVVFGGVGGLPSGGVPEAPSPGLNFGIIGENIRFGGLEIPTLSALVRAVQTDSDIRVVATPQILTADNEEATIQVATNLPFVTRVDQGTEDTDRTVQVFEYRDVGYTLKVTPRISDNRTVRLSVEAEAKAVVSAQTQDAQGNILLAPTTTVRQAKTVVLTKDGEILVIGGLIGQELEEKGERVPCLGHIPVLGWAFKSTQDQGRRTNLFIFLSPHILASEEEIRALSQEKLDKSRELTPEKPRDLLSPFRPKVDQPEILGPKKDQEKK
ncbi:MAG: type II secretion system secretin GspD [Deltaproteobacteria bacterium]|nr:type II secretion system secretin GspD [Deltaproteobacteria bacterium]